MCERQRRSIRLCMCSPLYTLCIRYIVRSDLISTYRYIGTLNHAEGYDITECVSPRLRGTIFLRFHNRYPILTTVILSSRSQPCCRVSLLGVSADDCGVCPAGYVCFPGDPIPEQCSRGYYCPQVWHGHGLAMAQLWHGYGRAVALLWHRHGIAMA